MKKVIPLLILTMACLFCFACATPTNEGLNELPFNAKLFDKVERQMTEAFLAENQTHYPSSSDGLPDTVCKVIDSQPEYDKRLP